MQSIIDEIKSLGYKVYMRKPKDTWLYYTDGNNIGQVEFGRNGIKVFSVHIPNSKTGTGFIISDGEIITDALLRSAFCRIPEWYWQNCDSVIKFRNWEHFTSSSSWNSEYKPV